MSRIINLKPMSKERDVSIETRVIKLRSIFWDDFMSSKRQSLKMNENKEQFDLMVQNAIKDTKERYKFIRNEDWTRTIYYKTKNVRSYFQ